LASSLKASGHVVNGEVDEKYAQMHFFVLFESQILWQFLKHA